MGKKSFNELNKGQVGFFVKRDVFGKGNLLGIPSLLAQACVVAALPARLTGAGLPFGPDRAAAVTFSVSNMTKIPQYQLQMTVDSAYMAAVGVLRTGLCAGHPALKEILVSLMRGQLLARLTHVIDDDNTARYLESLTVEDAEEYPMRFGADIFVGFPRLSSCRDRHIEVRA